MSSWAGNGALALAALLLAHAGFSASHFLGLVQERFGDVTAPLPGDIFVECAAGFALAAAGAILSTAPFKPMKMSTEVKQRAWEAMRSRPDFVTFPALSKRQLAALGAAADALSGDAAADSDDSEGGLPPVPVTAAAAEEEGGVEELD